MTKLLAELRRELENRDGRSLSEIARKCGVAVSYVCMTKKEMGL